MSPHPSVFILEAPSSTHFSVVLEQELLTNKKYSGLPQILITSYDESENGKIVEHKLSSDKSVLKRRFCSKQQMLMDQKECKQNLTKATIPENEFSCKPESSLRDKQKVSLVNVWQISEQSGKENGNSSFNDEKCFPLFEKQKRTPKCEMRISGDCGGHLSVKWRRGTTLRANTARHLQKCKTLPNVTFGPKNVSNGEDFKRNSHKKVGLSFSNSQLLNNHTSKPDTSLIRDKHKKIVVGRMSNKSLYERHSTGKAGCYQVPCCTTDRLPIGNNEVQRSALEAEFKHLLKLPRERDSNHKISRRIGSVQENAKVLPAICTRKSDVTDKMSTRKMKEKMVTLSSLNLSEVSSAKIVLPAGTKKKPLSATAENILVSDKYNKTKSFSSRGKERI